jgi:hypothetical protein
MTNAQINTKMEVIFFNNITGEHPDYCKDTIAVLALFAALAGDVEVKLQTTSKGWVATVMGDANDDFDYGTARNAHPAKAMCLALLKSIGEIK